MATSAATAGTRCSRSYRRGHAPFCDPYSGTLTSALLCRVAHDHLGGLPAPGLHDRWQLLARAQHVLCRATRVLCPLIHAVSSVRPARRAISLKQRATVQRSANSVFFNTAVRLDLEISELKRDVTIVVSATTSFARWHRSRSQVPRARRSWRTSPIIQRRGMLLRTTKLAVHPLQGA
jgi:hypothetical protein